MLASLSPAIAPIRHPDSLATDLAGLTALAATLAPLPVVAIGGIGVREAAQVMAGGAAGGIAVVSAICGARDPEAAARALRREIDAGRGRREGAASGT